MQLNELKQTWNFIKFQNSWSAIESEEILSIIEGNERSYKAKVQRVLLSFSVFVIITFFCQGG